MSVPGTSTLGDHERGASLVEFGLVLPFLALLVMGVLDLGRAWQLQNRLSNAAHEAASVVQFFPTNVAAGCDGGNNAVDRARGEDAGLAAMDGFAVEVRKKGGSVVTGCATSPVAIAPGDRLVVTVEARMDIIAPIVGAFTGDPVTVRRNVEVVVQG